MLKTISAGAFVALSLALSAQSSLAQNVCSALPTADGFVALRDRPSPKGKLIERMVPGDFVVVDRVGYDWVVSGHWYRVQHYRGVETFPEPSDPEYRKVKRGWVNERYVGECG